MNAPTPQGDAEHAALRSGPRTPEEELARTEAVMDLACAAGFPGLGRWHVKAGTSVKAFRHALVNRQRRGGPRTVGGAAFTPEMSRAERASA